MTGLRIRPERVEAGVVRRVDEGGEVDIVLGLPLEGDINMSGVNDE